MRKASNEVTRLVAVVALSEGDIIQFAGPMKSPHKRTRRTIETVRDNGSSIYVRFAGMQRGSTFQAFDKLCKVEAQTN